MRGTPSPGGCALLEQDTAGGSLTTCLTRTYADTVLDAGGWSAARLQGLQPQSCLGYAPLPVAELLTAPRLHGSGPQHS